MITKSRVAIVEDDVDFLESVTEFLISSGYRAWGADSAEVFYRRFSADPVDVVVLDIGLPGEDGISVASVMKANPSVAVIILSARDSVEDRLAGLRAGADRYLIKPVNLMELAANIDIVFKNLTLVSKPLLGLPSQGNQTRKSAPKDIWTPNGDIWQLLIRDWVLITPTGISLKLTAREFALLHKLIEVQGQAVPKKELANELFGARVPNNIERVNVLIARLRKKASDTLGSDLPIKTAHQVGYAFTAPATLTS